MAGVVFQGGANWIVHSRVSPPKTLVGRIAHGSYHAAVDSHERTHGLRIRPATRDDVPLILQLVRELAEYERAAEQVVATRENLDRFLFGGGHGKGPLVEALIGELDGNPEAFALFFSNFSTWLSTSGIYLEDLFVRPNARRRGLGRALLKEIASIAVRRGCGRVEWSVLNWNTPAIEFYESLGAHALREWTVFRLSAESLRKFAQDGLDGVG